MQDHYNLLAREEEREMIPLCLDEGIGTIVWSPLARGRLARPFGDAKSTSRSESDGGYADTLYSPVNVESDRAIIDAVGSIAAARGVSRAQVALAWLHSKPVVTATLVGANTPEQIDDAVASLAIELTSDELASMEQPYTPRDDFQGVSDEAEMQRIRDQIAGYAHVADSK
jgi:1-deoxyxylulose-5-phosphate synthase